MILLVVIPLLILSSIISIYMSRSSLEMRKQALSDVSESIANYLEEFYKIRVADHKAVASGATESDEETVQSARELVEEINHEVNRQLDDRVRIYEEKILPALRKNHIIFYQDRHVEPFHQQFIKDFFPGRNLPLPATRARIERQNRLFSARQPALPRHPPLSEGKQEPRQPAAFLFRHEAAVRQSAPFHRTSAPWRQLLHHVHRGHHQSEPQPYFPRLRRRFELLHQISRDADILIDDTASSADLVAQLKKKVKKRKIGDVCRFVYDRAMPQDFLDFLVDAFRIHRDELVPGDKHLNLET